MKAARPPPKIKVWEFAAGNCELGKSHSPPRWTRLSRSNERHGVQSPRKDYWQEQCVSVQIQIASARFIVCLLYSHVSLESLICRSSFLAFKLLYTLLKGRPRVNNRDRIDIKWWAWSDCLHNPKKLFSSLTTKCCRSHNSSVTHCTQMKNLTQSGVCVSQRERERLGLGLTKHPQRTSSNRISPQALLKHTHTCAHWILRILAGLTVSS